MSHTCVGGEGAGKALFKMGGLLSMCVRFNLSYVCDPSHWVTGGHETGSIGHLFGCLGKNRVIGDPSDIISSTDARKLPRKRIGFKYLTDLYGKPSRMSPSSSVSLWSKTELLRFRAGQPLPLYDLSLPQLCAVTTLGEARPWISRQYNQARLARNYSVPLWQRAPWRILLFFRRGDRRGASVGQGINLLRNLLHAAPWLGPNNSKILVLAETPKNDPEMKALLALSNLILLCEEPRSKKGQRAKLVRDLDYAATANIILSTGGGSFAGLLTSIMAEGIAFDINVRSNNGRFPCAFDVAGAVASRGGRTADSDTPPPYSLSASKTALMNQSEQAVVELLSFYRAQRLWNYCFANKALLQNPHVLKHHPCSHIVAQDVNYSLPHLPSCPEARLPDIQWVGT